METKTEPFGDPLSRKFWEGAARHELWIQHCPDCGRHQFYPRPVCVACSRTQIEWVHASGRGTVYTLTRIWRSGDPSRRVPYINALVELDEGPRLFTTLVDGEFEIGQRVEIAWQERDDGPPLPVFRLAGSGS